MDATRFDTIIRTLAQGSSRRAMLHAMATALGLGAVRGTQLMWAKSRKKKLKRNAFGCVSVGGKCRGKDRVCCSGICQGKKPKHGAKDTSRCVAHDAGDCLPGPEHCDDHVECATSAGNPGTCATTTGGAGYCLDVVPGFVQPCRRDAECQEAMGASAACAYCPSNDTASCVGIQAS